MQESLRQRDWQQEDLRRFGLAGAHMKLIREKGSTGVVVARKLAAAFDVPVKMVYVYAGIMTEQEAEATVILDHSDLSKVSRPALVAEIDRRLKLAETAG